MGGVLDEYKGKRVFLSGHTGFKGSWMCLLLTMLGADVTGYALECGTQPNMFGIMGIEKTVNSIYGDVRDYDRLSASLDEASPEIVLHLAAQPLVRESYKDPVYTYATNVMGTAHILEAVRAAKKTPRSVVIVTTDKVYDSNHFDRGCVESDLLDGYDPYSNSKSCAELVTSTYTRCFLKDAGTAVSSARAGNVIGGGDFAKDRIIPDCVRAAMSATPIDVRNPSSVRPYQHVIEPVTAYLEIALRQLGDPSLASSYNIGPDEDGAVSTETLVNLFCKKWGGASWLARRDENAPHEAEYLKLNCDKIKKRLGWSSVWSIETAIEKTVEWTKCWLQNGDLRRLTEGQISEYLSARYGA